MPDGIGVAVRKSGKGVIEGGFENGRPALTYKMILKQPPKYASPYLANKFYYEINMRTPENAQFKI